MRKQRGPIALVTDFGVGDWFAGVMEGVILSVNPDARVVHVVHAVPRHNTVAGSFAVLVSHRFFPPETVFAVVVDPGVGGRRRIVCVRTGGRLFLAPDNGVLTGVLSKGGFEEAVSVENEEFFLTPVSSTFHGRDIFAPVAAHLSLGLDMRRLGPALGNLETLDLPAPEVGPHGIVATVRWVDGFGNLITDCPGDVVGQLQMRWEKVVVDAGSVSKIGIGAAYGSVERGKVLGVIGSSGFLEIAVREGSASERLGIGIGDSVIIRRG